ncbi:hypothetical protein CNBM1240 [Cryptococcus deneoformans B-3501A]|uniref:hypothetical protein n=1 Tax=Cryptococcus deneoformans (strain B-3501A) TaxID=283643 RepID=UPI000042F829|nr:hypothetical protein CNBM1240 [Cryptococcus neoformans var. neoformans B-3501A]EAL17558.1 hypothetical protein CNBM1240 [Cryptococcus neoformans var. neoformans B-3501A]
MATAVASPSLLSPIPSTSKRSAPSPSSSQPVKRPRQSSSSSKDEDEVAASDEELDEETRAKLARKEARTIRNRESAQRSRNARKAHVAWLEKRVVELEAENRSLKGEPPTSTDPVPTAATPEPAAQPPAREASTEHDVLSFANDLGIPAEVVSSGVSLSNVAPPPSSVDVDVKPIIEPSPLTLASPAVVLTSNDDLMAIKTENANLRQRVTLLENLVKQVVAIANFSPPVPSTSQRTPVNQFASLPAQSSLDWSSTLSATSILPAGLSSTLSPGLPARNSTVSTTSASQLPHLAQTSQPELASSRNVSNSVACHSARARGNYSMHSLALALAKDEKRMAQVARLIIALARHKGWISHPQQSNQSLNMAWKGCLEGRKCRQRSRVGMRR